MKYEKPTLVPLGLNGGLAEGAPLACTSPGGDAGGCENTGGIATNCSPSGGSAS